MVYLLKRHPFEIEAFFRHSLVLTYALPRNALDPLLPPGLVLDTYEDYGFLAIALVQTTALRPRPLPAWMGQDFFLSGYRIFTRLDRAASGVNGRSALRGLRILRSDTDRRFMAIAGNWFTHYRYEHAQIKIREDGNELNVQIKTRHSDADLTVTAEIGREVTTLPETSPFPNMQMARRFAGPLPYTFDYEAETNSIVSVRGVRGNWDPKPVRVRVDKCAYLDRERFRKAAPRLANAFYLRDVPYRWERGVRFPLGEE